MLESLSLKNGKNVKFPALWFTIWFEDELRKRYKKYIKEEFRENFLINTFHVAKFFSKPQHPAKSFSELLKFQGNIMLDSGGFVYQISGKSPPSVDEYLNMVNTHKPDIVVALDFPLTPLSKHENEMRIRRTLKNIVEIQEKFSSLHVNVMPVIHGFSIKTIESMLQFMERYDIDLSYVGMGSLVPLIRHRVKGGRKIIVDLIAYVRKRLSSSILHIFGIGGTTTMHIMFFLGVNSIDTAAWERKAANGVIQLPGIGDRFLSKKPHNRTILKPSEMNVLKECKCPICSNYENTEQKMKILDNKRDCRVVHNAWVYQREVDIAREMVNQGNYEKYIEKVLRSASFLSLFHYAKSVAKQNRLNHIL